MYDLNEVLPDPPGIWPFHIKDYIPDFIVFINNLVVSAMLSQCNNKVVNKIVDNLV